MRNDQMKKLWITLLTAIGIIVIGALFIENNSWFGYTDSALLYLAGIVGAGCFWIGINHEK